MKKIGKVCVTTGFGAWWVSELSDIFTTPDEVTIIGTVVEEGALYLIYTWEDK